MDGCTRTVYGNYYWLPTVHPDGRTHVRPLLAVWFANALYFCSEATTRETGNLTPAPRCSLATETAEFHFVAEGEATKQSDEATLQDVTEVYATKYGWEGRIRDGAFSADEASIAANLPHEVYEVTPETIFGSSLDTSVPSTRWQFA